MNDSEEDVAQISVNSGVNLIWGAEAIGKKIKRGTRAAQYLLETGQIPGTKVGNHWVSDETELDNHFAELIVGS